MSDIDPTTTHELAGPVGRAMADQMTEKLATVIDEFPASSQEQRAAIARLIADNLYTRYEDAS